MDEKPDWVARNRERWDERVPIHLDSEYYGVERFIAGGSTLRPFDLAEVGAVDGRTLVHPQCHFGLDTLSWARRGARVTGLDFSPPAIAAARAIAERAGIEAEFVEANVYDAVDALGGRRFDIVYTGLGALNWLPDVERWARTMVELMATGGRFYLAEFHPFSNVFGDDELIVSEPYFDQAPRVYDEPGTYADLTAPTVNNVSVEWQHGIGEVVSALAAAGLRIEWLHEHDYTVDPRWPFLHVDADRNYRMPPRMPSLPLIYSLGASL